MNLPKQIKTLPVLLAIAVAFFAAGLLSAPALAAQTPAATAAQPAKHKAHRHARPNVPPPAAPVAVAAAPVVPAAPVIPLWPANDHPTDATVQWDSHGLRVEAANSSLQQILNDFSTETGVKVQGFSSDVRVFGVYGPGPARDVLAQLLQGTGYNVLMVGEQGPGTPKEILLTPRQAGGAQPQTAAAPSTDEDAETDEQPQPAFTPTRQGFAPGVPPHDPRGDIRDPNLRRLPMPPNQPPQN